MPQVSLYMNDQVYARVRRAADMEQLSVSKWVARTVEKSLSEKWPNDFEDLFGSIGDETFAAPDRHAMVADAPRESL